MRVSVDDESCCGHGVCVALCPDIFAITDDGYAEAAAGEIAAEDEPAVAEAAASCPEHAIQVIVQTMKGV